MKIMTLGALFAAPSALAQDAGIERESSEQERELGDPVAWVTVLTAPGVNRGPGGGTFRTENGRFSTEESGVRPGEPVVTPPGGSAVLAFPDFDMSVHLQADSELRLLEAPGMTDQMPFALLLTKGSMFVARKTADQRWLLVACQSAAGQAYTLSKGTSLVVAAEGGGPRFSVSQGAAFFFSGSTPAGEWVDAAGQPIDRTGVAVSQGQQISTHQPAPAADAESGRAAASGLHRDWNIFGLDMGREWVSTAEAGDLTPVRGESRATAQMVAESLGVSEPAFDQARAIVATPSPRTTRPAAQAAQVGNIVNSLLGSRNPAQGLVGVRIQRSRIIGNPGAAGSGPIRINPQAQLSIRLAGVGRPRITGSQAP